MSLIACSLILDFAIFSATLTIEARFTILHNAYMAHKANILPGMTKKFGPLLLSIVVPTMIPALVGAIAAIPRLGAGLEDDLENSDGMYDGDGLDDGDGLEVRNELCEGG